MDLTDALSAKELTKRYPGAPLPAVDGVSLTVRKGEIFGLLGPNGAGKTTTLSLLSTILAPDSGSITLCGIDSLKHPTAARRKIGLVPQDIALYPELTAWENLTFFARLHGMTGSRLADGIASVLAAVGLSEKARQQVATYSGGMKRRLNLAIGMVHSPQVLFLDEPTVGIDAQSRELILTKLKELKKAGTTLLYTTHYMEEAETLCDRVAVMDRGKLLVSGTPAELLAQHSCGTLGDLFLELTGKELRD